MQNDLSGIFVLRLCFYSAACQDWHNVFWQWNTFSCSGGNYENTYSYSDSQCINFQLKYCRATNKSYNARLSIAETITSV